MIISCPKDVGSWSVDLSGVGCQLFVLGWRWWTALRIYVINCVSTQAARFVLISYLEVYLKRFDIICKLVGRSDVWIPAMAVRKNLWCTGAAAQKARETVRGCRERTVEESTETEHILSAPQASAASRTSATLEQSERSTGDNEGSFLEARWRTEYSFQH